MQQAWLELGRIGAALATVLLLVLPAQAAQAQEGAVAGQVIDETGTRPLEGAQVFVAGTEIGTLTDAQGRYRLTGVPAGEARIQVRLIGFTGQTQTITVQAGQTVNLDFALAVEALGVDELVVTATGVRRKRELANAVAEINAAEVETAPINTFADLLTGRASNVQILNSGGTTGSGTRVRVRGSSSVSLSNEPLIYVDGVRVNNEPSAFFQDLTGGQAPSRLNDINPEDIETIEIVKGPSAATLYGTEAANGVIRITTRQGTEGETRWRLYGEVGALEDVNDYPANFLGVDAAGEPCDLLGVAAGDCEQAEIRSFNLLENPETTPFRTGVRQQYGGSLAGGAAGGLLYYTSGEWEREEGVVPANDLERVNLRANLGMRPRDDLNLSLSTGYVSSDLALPQNDNNTFGYHGNALLGSASEDGWFALTPEEITDIAVLQEIERFTGSATADYDPLAWLNARLSGGLDVTNREDVNFFPVGAIPLFGLETGFRIVDRFQALNYTLDAASTASVDLSDAIRSETSVGLQFFQETTTGTSTTGEDLAAGSSSLATAAITEATEETIESKTLGVFVQQQFGLNDRLFLTGAVRGDDNSAFGEDFDIVVYPKVSASWVVSDEDFFPDSDVLSSVRLRGAWGQSGNQPGVTDAVRFLRGVPATTPDDADAIGVTFVPDFDDPNSFGGLGNPDLEPERSSEIEAGFDAALWGDRLTLEATYYDKDTKDALVFRNVAPSLGTVGGRFENIGNTENKGVEFGVTAVPIQLEDVTWEVSFSGSYNDNTLLELGEGVEPFSFGFEQRHAPGFPLGGFWERPILSFDDADGNGILDPSEVALGDTLVFIDDAVPSTELSFRTTFGLFGLVRLSGLLDYRGGHSLHNNTNEFRCRLGNAQVRHDPSSSLADQAACIADAFGGTEVGYIENAEFLKLRELALTFDAPERWAQRIGADRMSLTLSGRNLATWTPYDGVDPEINQFGQQFDAAGFATSEFLSQPPVRYLTARLNLGF